MIGGIFHTTTAPPRQKTMTTIFSGSFEAFSAYVKLDVTATPLPHPLLAALLFLSQPGPGDGDPVSQAPSLILTNR